jgi:xylan 1,4-beta-xylosidase
MINLTKTNEKMPSSLFKTVSVGRAYELLRHEHFEQFKKLQEEIGFEYVRFHGLFHDDMGVAIKDNEGKIRYRWHNIDKAFDSLKAINIKPFVQLGAMPEVLAEGPETIFWWKMHVSRPKDYNEWYDLVYNFVSHVVDRYGLDEVRTWYFEVWNEPNLKGFWPHGMEEYFKLYTYAARAVRAVDSQLRVGGPASAGCAYIAELIDYCDKNSVPIDFVTTHEYPVAEYCGYPDREGSPYELGRYFKGRFEYAYELVRNSAMPELEIHWTEWNTQSTDSSKNITWIYNPTVDMHFGGASVAKEMLSVMKLCDSVAYWVVSDLFEEAGPQHTPYSCTYGLFTIHGVRKATYNAYRLLRKLRGNLMSADFEKAPPTLCDVCATEENGIYRAIVYNHNALEIKNQPDFIDSLCFDAPDGEYIATYATIKQHKGSAYETWLRMGMPENLSKIQEEMLQAHSVPEYDFTIVKSKDGKIEIPFALKPNEVMYVEIEKKGLRAYLGNEDDSEISQLNEMLMTEKKA